MTLSQPHFHITLKDGRLSTQLSDHEKRQIALNPSSAPEAAQLLRLNGKSIEGMLVDKDSRSLLEALVSPEVSRRWRIHSNASAAILSALQGVSDARCPLRPLSGGMRLAFVDELETIRCVKALPGFDAGKRYPVRCVNRMASRDAKRVNLQGIEEDVYQFGEERVTLIRGEGGVDRVFVDPHHFREADFSLEDLLDAFDPETPPSVAERFPEVYAQKVSMIMELQAAMNRQIERMGT